MDAKYEVRIDKQGRVLIPGLLRRAVGINRDSTVTIKQVRAGDGFGLLIEAKGEKEP